MKQIFLAFCILLVAGVSLAAEDDMTIGGGLGFAMPFGDLSDSVDAGVTMNLFGEFYLTDLMGIRGMFNYHTLSGQKDLWGYYEYYTIETDLSIVDVLIDGTARFDLTDKMYITAMGGLGAYISKWEIDGPIGHATSETETDVGVNLGGNFTYQLTRNWGIQGNLIYHIVNMDDWESWMDFTVTAAFSL